jgi:large repetitive protein
VTVTGSGFTGATAVSFGTSAGANVTVAPGGTQLTTLLSAGAGVVDVTVTVAGVAPPALAAGL